MKLLILWHMHQPTYKDYLSGRYHLPWVYLHTTKDYYEMVHLVEPFERVKLTFNLVPSLIEAVLDYASGDAQDEFLRHFEERPETMTEEEKRFVVDNFFFINVEHGIQPSARYTELYLRRSQRQPFSAGDLRDLQVHFHLAWFGESFKREDRTIRRLVEKDRGFSEADKQALLGRVRWVFKSTLGLYRRLWDEGRIELSTTPYYHPILPLLCDTNAARASFPSLPLPEARFAYAEDGQLQARKALDYFEQVLGRRPQGVWPAEGSVSQEALGVLARCGAKWAATDEDILHRSTVRDVAGEGTDPSLRPYCGYRFETGDGDMALFFRDHGLSDLIGFTYQRWPADVAVKDFMGRLRRIYERRPDAAVSVILDGENAWEGYEANGYDFLTQLYGALDQAEWVEATTFSDYLDQNPKMGRLKSIHPGSWIDANYNTWIGHPEKNRAWVYLKRARDAVAQLPSADAPGHDGISAVARLPEAAQKSLLAAEGSDWFWWFGDTHSSLQDPVFDLLFRTHLKNVYVSLGLAPPLYLDAPVGIHSGALQREPVAFMTPKIDGRDTNFFEWASAGLLHLDAHGTMHRAATIMSRLYFGFDRENLYLRVDFGKRASHVLTDLRLEVELASPHQTKTLRIGRGEISQGAAVRDIVEIKVPFRELGVTAGDTFEIILVLRGEREVERYPQSGAVTLDVPGEELEWENWMV